MKVKNINILRAKIYVFLKVLKSNKLLFTILLVLAVILSDRLYVFESKEKVTIEETFYQNSWLGNKKHAYFKTKDGNKGIVMISNNASLSTGDSIIVIKNKSIIFGRVHYNAAVE
ncbi:hypothetical protein [Zooshikella ganghwensis]|uniref:Uncharacterized protein n=1 Tax=Zooshikella ganghwensis TaxID=202772 RepID=A0A4P9VR41_9GAMM|nr:hypothetical protein [Zooshikella ganghwensis]RDH45259.1 hypothetical protein B9G39_18410 [Zooshikella ganghwensis]